MAPKVYIVMAVYRPDLSFLEEQIASVLHQTHANFELLVVPDGPAPEVESLPGTAQDTRVRVCRQTDHIGVYRNFLRGLEIALGSSGSENDLFAYCDQDDVWARDKLAIQCARLADDQATMCYSDASVIDDRGQEIHPSVFGLERRIPHRAFHELLTANDVTGATMMFTKSVAGVACRGPVRSGSGFLHDWWTALVSARLGKTVFLPEPLVAYRRHKRNFIGPKAESQTDARQTKRPFLSKSYLRMCEDQLSLRRYLLAALEELIPDERRFGYDASSKGTAIPGLSHLLIDGLGWTLRGHSQLTRNATRLVLGYLMNLRSHDKEKQHA